MSLHLEFEPHTWYMGFAIRDNLMGQGHVDGITKWTAYIDDGNTYQIVELEANTLDRLKSKIRQYHLRKHNGYGERIAKRRLEYLRSELRAEQISYGEIAELQGLASYIKSDDVELLEAAGVPEDIK